ncbi:MAG TPA: hypothetical protein VMP12_02850 [Candidatus Sulfotelmatobacter sp.]|nr:hypothetical protein [Candidatus Sulfotelmatobacter sp.]
MANPTVAVLVGGGTAAFLDGLTATVDFGMRGVSFTRLWQGVASGALGPSSFQHGAATAVLGLFFHTLIAMTAALVFNLAASYVPALFAHFIFAGVAYGIVVYLFMTFVVIPLSVLPHRPVTFAGSIKPIIVHMICVGLPISIAAWWYAKK